MASSKKYFFDCLECKRVFSKYFTKTTAARMFRGQMPRCTYCGSACTERASYTDPTWASSDLENPLC